MKLLSWNIQWGRGADGRVDLARSAAAIRAAGDFDVICLQEVACNFPGLAGGAREDEAAALGAAFAGYEAVYAAAVDLPDGEGGRARFGNLLLSRLPVGQVFRHLLPSPADPAYPAMQRVCVEAVVQAPWGALRVMTTHLEYYSAVQRRAQVEALRGLQAEAADLAARPPALKEANPSFAAPQRPAAAVLCGDFNCEPGSAEHLAMLQPLPAAPWGDARAHWVDAWQLVHGAQPHAPTVGLHGAEWPDRAYCCDYFFVTTDLAARVRELEVMADTAASDHQPVVLTFEAQSSSRA
ncbi:MULTISPECIES: endonuclease/exonuclease/phosphatase family protein [unclassified Thauera]|uniref:endonuclease/exonuclease/phosphatase family protein n=1 Tax=unclassified Thauera TaxID=2609274 RepID=UPI0002CF1FA0|nr:MULTISPECIES: endonuclease/exonuclease/phosphatase family protein [unclassified Thauera]ENO92088.1 endonuclease/exonuclease/phosphatase [Thauera sp. 28]WBL63124.1 endonuclease/exonuclease/phosphatase family protein [Thauera sp. WB-2]HAY10094.1 endonuclease [Thauera sp.]HRJ25007.1 endonuclease/exonuclease/phosphatase family protein [Thauera sp.]HRK11816.1 endonuclease/exonuclease/phosphatase family protein [Thauera sp.]